MKLTFFFKYDKQNKKLERKGEIKTNSMILKIFEAKNGNIIACLDKGFVVYDKNRSIQTKINKVPGNYSYSIVDNKYLLIAYQNKENYKYYVEVYNIENFISLRTFEVKYQLLAFIKLNDNLLIASSREGNIFEFNIGNNFQLSTKDIFRAHESPISELCKFDDNKILSISHDGTIKLWEFN